LILAQSLFWVRSGLVPKIFKKNIFEKICNFPVYFVTEFCLILVCILYRKDTNPVLKILSFRPKKKSFCFHAYGQVSQRKITSYFHTTKKNSKKKSFSMHFDFNNQFIKVTRTWPKFQKFKKHYFVFF